MPPGNQKDNDTWTPKRQQKGEIKLTPGKGLQDLSCSVTDLIGQVVKANKVGMCSPLIALRMQCHEVHHLQTRGRFLSN